MKSTIVYIFKVIISLIVSGVLWLVIIGFPQDNTDTGMFGTPTAFKQGIWETAKAEYTETYLRVSDNNGQGYADRTYTIWDNAVEVS